MAMRRRIKVAVNLASARKPKQEPPDNASGASIIVKAEPGESTSETLEIGKEQITESYRPSIKPKAEHTSAAKTDHSDTNAFKFPPKVEFNRSNSSQPTDDIQHIEIDDGVQVMQMDLQNSANAMSPLKSQRHRIKPTPVFGQRRNSFVGTPTTSTANEDIEQAVSTTRRERHYSGSQNLSSISSSATGRTRTESTSSQKRERHYSGSQNTISQSSMSTGKSVGRIRTESTCSVYSDSHLSTISKFRKTDDQNSQRSSLRREFEARFSNGVPEKSSLKMSDLIYYNPVTNPMEQKPKITEIKAEVQETEPECEKTEKDSAIPVPQLKLNAKGELILDDKSLEIETTAEQEARKVLAKSSLIFLDENTGMNGFYKRHKRTRDWPADETIRFFRCLQTIGTDFSLMCQLFPKRTRRDLKLKFKKEERCNAALINKALLYPNSFDIQELKDQFDMEDREREEEEKERKAAKEKEKQAKKEYRKITIRESKSARALKNAQDAYKICEGNLGSEAQPPIKTRKPRTTKKKAEQEIDVGNPVEEITNIKSTRKPRQIKAKTAKTPKSQVHQQNLSTQLAESSLKMEAEEMNEVGTINYPFYEITSLESDALPPDSIQQHFSMLVEDEHLERQQQNDTEAPQHQHSSTDDEAPRTFVNLDSGNLTIKKTEVPYADLNKKGAPHLSSKTLFAAQEGYSALPNLYADEADDDNNDEMSYGDMEIETETIDRKPQINIEKPTESCILENAPSSMVLSEQSPYPTGTDMQQAQQGPNSTPPPPPTNDESHSIEIDNEMAIQQILEDIASGTLQVVSSYDPDNPEDMVTEIFMVDPKTGDLCDEPLDLPTELVQSILAVMM